MKKCSLIFLIPFVFFSLNATAVSNTCISGKKALEGSKIAYKKALDEIKEASERENNATNLLQKCLEGLKGINFTVGFPSTQVALDQIVNKVCSMAVDKANELIDENITNKVNSYESFINSISNNVDNIVNDINNINADGIGTGIDNITNTIKNTSEISDLKIDSSELNLKNSYY